MPGEMTQEEIKGIKAGDTLWTVGYTMAPDGERHPSVVELLVKEVGEHGVTVVPVRRSNLHEHFDWNRLEKCFVDESECRAACHKLTPPRPEMITCRTCGTFNAVVSHPLSCWKCREVLIPAEKLS